MVAAGVGQPLQVGNCVGDRVVLEREASEEKTSGGILLPDSAKDKPARGEIVSVGNGRLLDDGTRSQLQVKVGERVIFSSYAGDTFTVGDEELLLMSASKIDNKDLADNSGPRTQSSSSAVLTFRKSNSGD